MSTTDGWEIERRYLVAVREGLWEELGPGLPYRQGYVRVGRPSVRIRTGEPRGAVLTCKTGGGVRRREVEAVVPEDVAEALFEAAEERVIRKARHRLGPWELDRFAGPLDGLTLLEIELDHEDDPVPEPPAGVEVLREVTHDKRFTSGALARLTPVDQERLVVVAYAEVGR